VARARPEPTARDARARRSPISCPCRGTRQHRPRPHCFLQCWSLRTNGSVRTSVIQSPLTPASRTGAGTGARDLPRAPRHRPRRRGRQRLRSSPPSAVVRVPHLRCFPNIFVFFCFRRRTRPANPRAWVNSGANPDATGPPPSRCPGGARAAERQGTCAAHASVSRCPPSLPGPAPAAPFRSMSKLEKRFSPF